MMNIQLIRNATIRLEYAGLTLLVDPFLADQGAYPAFPNSVRQDQKNPLVDLPLTVEEIIDGVDAVILTHLHLDHYDEVAKQHLPKDVKVFVQNTEDQALIENDGFTNVELLTDESTFKEVELIKVKGEHGRGEILKLTGEVCGVILKHDTEQTLYIAGDTVWYEEVAKNIKSHAPSVIVVNAGDNQFHAGGSLVMGKEDVHAVHQSAPDASIIAVHMEAVNHWTLSREDLRRFAASKHFSSKLVVPEDGQIINTL